MFQRPKDFLLCQDFLLLRSHLTRLRIQHNTPSVKPSVSDEGGDLREASFSSLGSITYTSSLTGKCAFANDYKSGSIPWLKIHRQRQFRYMFRATGPPSGMVTRNVQFLQTHNCLSFAWSPKKTIVRFKYNVLSQKCCIVTILKFFLFKYFGNILKRNNVLLSGVYSYIHVFSRNRHDNFKFTKCCILNIFLTDCVCATLDCLVHVGWREHPVCQAKPTKPKS